MSLAEIQRMQSRPGSCTSGASSELFAVPDVIWGLGRVSIKSGEKQTMTVHEELEDFELTVEQLEEANRLARLASPLKRRRALILSDNLAEILTYRFCQERYRDDFAFVQAFPPKLSRNRWRKILGSYRERINACYSKFDLLSRTDWAILRIGHRYRNASYHRDFHNKAAVAILAELMREAVCRLFARVYSNGCSVGGGLRESTAFLAPYGLQGDLVDFRMAATSIGQKLANDERLDPQTVRDALSADIRDRVDRLIGNRKRFWASMTDAEINEGMKWIEFQRKHPVRIDAIWQPARKLKYLMMDVVREVDRPVSADGFYEAVESAWRARTGEHPRDQIRALDSIESRCRQEERLLFEAFKSGHKWESLEKVKMRGCELRSGQDVDTCLDRYFALDARLGGIERHYEEAMSAVEAADEAQYELDAGK